MKNLAQILKNQMKEVMVDRLTMKILCLIALRVVQTYPLRVEGSREKEGRRKVDEVRCRVAIRYNCSMNFIKRFQKIVSKKIRYSVNRGVKVGMAFLRRMRMILRLLTRNSFKILLITKRVQRKAQMKQKGSLPSLSCNN